MATRPVVKLQRTPTGYRTKDGRFIVRALGQAHHGGRAFCVTDMKTGMQTPACELTACRLYIASCLAFESPTPTPTPKPLTETQSWPCYRPRR